MAERIIFLYYILCYSIGIMGLLASLFAAASGWGRAGPRNDLRFSLFSASFALIVIPTTIFAYIGSAGIALDLRMGILSALAMAGESGFIFSLPFFMGGFLEPPRKAGAMKVWILLACLSASTLFALAAIFLSPPRIAVMLSYVLYIPTLAMIAAIIEAFFSGKRALARLRSVQSGNQGDGSIQSDYDTAVRSDDALRWTRILRSFMIMSSVAFIPMLVIDFFPVFLYLRIPDVFSLFKIHPALYAALNAVYAVESFKFTLRRGRRVGFDASRSDLDAAARRHLTAAAVPAGLSPREEEVAVLLASGATYKELCWKLRIKQGTAQSHVSSVYRKLGVNCKEELMRLARGEGRS
jgi:DNA-binding CsgD family transcriptional regulator